MSERLRESSRPAEWIRSAAAQPLTEHSCPTSLIGEHTSRRRFLGFVSSFTSMLGAGSLLAARPAPAAESPRPRAKPEERIAISGHIATGTVKKATFVLVHGAWHGGWCYARVAEILRAQGHRVFTPTLTGLGERSHLASAGPINCSTHIRDVINVIRWEQLTNVVLCGHSYGGIVIGGVADAVSGHVASLVYLDTFVPQNGQSILSVAEPMQVIEVLKIVASHGGQWLPPPPAEIFNVNAADRAMVDRLCTPQPFATYTERLNLTGAHMSIAKKAFVIATDWQGAPPTQRAYDQLKADDRWLTFEVSCGHDVMLDAPDRLAEILLSVAP